MSKQQKQILSIIGSIIIAIAGLFGINIIGEENPSIQNNNTELTHQSNTNELENAPEEINPDGHYTDVQNVKDFIVAFDKLPDNYITKDEAYDLGWVPNEGNLHDVAPGMSIGGDYFGNFEGHLPDDPSRDYYEADINYDGGYRGAERLVFSDDGLFFYTDDHYETFEEVK